MQAVFTILGHLSGSQLVIIVRCFSEEHHVSFFSSYFYFVVLKRTDFVFRILFWFSRTVKNARKN
jgi:hypothetical protein